MFKKGSQIQPIRTVQTNRERMYHVSGHRINQLLNDLKRRPDLARALKSFLLEETPIEIAVQYKHKEKNRQNANY